MFFLGDAKLWACPMEAHAQDHRGPTPMLAWVARCEMSSWVGFDSQQGWPQSNTKVCRIKHTVCKRCKAVHSEIT
jgi:hypothetical protein